MAPYTAIVSSLLFPLHERLKGHDSVAVRKQMERAQWWTPAELSAFQTLGLRELLVDVGAHVPYYRDLFARTAFDPHKVTGVADLQRLPFLTKALIRSGTEALKHPAARDLARFNTGGSSGEPLIFFIGKKRVSHDVAAKWRATRWWDVDIGDPEIVVWGSPIELGTQDRIKHWRDKLRPEQYAVLAALPWPAASRDALIDAHLQAARALLLHGRSIAAEFGVPWPDALERAVRAHLERELGVLL